MFEATYRRFHLGALSFQANSFGIDPKRMAKLARAGYHIAELPILYCPRTLDKQLRLLQEGVCTILMLIELRFQ